jgi:hypothetical protein
VRVRQSNLTLQDEPDIWSREAAWAYPACAANAQGVCGFSAFYGGGAAHPGHVVGVRTPTTWQTALTRVSSHGPANGSWGDYLSCLVHHPNSAQWAASGYTLQGTQRTNIEPRYVRFRA